MPGPHSQRCLIPLQVLKSLEARNTVQKSREELQAFQAALAQEFGALTKEDTLQLVNHAPTSILEAFLCLGDAVENERVAEDDLDRIVELVASHLH